MNPNFTLLEKITLGVALLALALSGSYLGQRVYATHTYLTPTNGGTYREAQIGQPRVPNPLFCPQNPTDQDICTLVFAGLTRFDPQKQRVVPDVALDWSISADEKNYTFYLNPEATWHDGEPVTTDDVVFTYETVLKNPDYQGPFTGIFEKITVEKIDNYTFIFRLEQPEAFFLRNTTIGLLPAHLLSAEPILHMENSAFNQKPIGCGPYKITSLNLTEAKLTRHEKYHGSQPFIENIVLNFYPDIFTLQQDQLRIRNIKEIPSTIRNEFATNPKFQLQNIELPQYVALFFNTEQPIIRHRQIRRALRNFIETKKIIKLVQPAKQILDPIFVRNTESASESSKYYNPKEGDKTLADLGWEKNEAGRYFIGRKNEDDKIEEELLQIKLLTTDRDDFRAIAEMIAAQLDWAGITVEVDIRNKDQFLGALAARDYDVLLYGESVGSDLDFYPFWHSSQSAFPGLNLSQYANLEVDRLLTEIRQTFVGEKQGELLVKIRDQLLADVPAIWLYTPLYTFAHEPDLKGTDFSGFSDLSDRLRQLTQSWYLKDKVKWKWH